MSKKKTIHDFRIKLLSGNNVVLVECPTYDSEIFVPKIRQGRIVFENLISSRDLINEEVRVLKSTKVLAKKNQNSSFINNKQSSPHRQMAGIELTGMQKPQDLKVINADKTTLLPIKPTTYSCVPKPINPDSIKHSPRGTLPKEQLTYKNQTTDIWELLNTSTDANRNSSVPNTLNKAKGVTSCTCFQKVPNKRNNIYLSKNSNKLKDTKWIKRTSEKLKDFRKLLNKPTSKTKLAMDSRYKYQKRYLTKYYKKLKTN